MKHSKKLFALLTAVAMMSSMLCITSFATGETTNTVVNIMTDDFDSYYLEADDVDGLTVAGGNRYVAKVNDTTNAETWYAASNFGENSALAGIVQSPTDETDQVLAIEADAAYYNRPVRPRVVYKNMNENTAISYTYKFDFYKETDYAGGGIIFNYDGSTSSNLNDCNYYMLNFVGKNDYAYGYNTDPGADLYSSVIVRKNIFQPDATIVTINDTATGMGYYNATNMYGNSSANAFSTNGYDYLPSKKWFSVALTYSAGTISWTVKDRATGSIVQTATWTDDEPVAPTTSGFALHAAGRNDNYMYFDNVSIEKTVSGVAEADNIIYYDAADIMSSSEGVYDLLNTAKICRITNNGEASDFTMQVSEDGETYTDVEVTFTEGKWINTEIDSKVRYITFGDESVVDNINIYCELEGGESFDIDAGETLDVIVRENGADVSEPDIILYNSLLSTDGSSIVALLDGTTDVHICGSGVVRKFSVRTIGEMTKAEIDGTEEEYLTAKTPIIEAISDATDAQTIYDILESGEEQDIKLSDIKDFDMPRIDALISADKLMLVAEALVDYTFVIEDIDDVRDFINTVMDEINLADICNIEDNEIIEALLDKYNGTYNLPLDNEYYLEYKDDVHTAMQSKTFETVDDLRECFVGAYIMAAYKNAQDSEEVTGIIRSSFIDIGVDIENYKAIKLKNVLSEELFLNQDSIDTIEDLRNFIDNYEEVLGDGFVFADDFESYECETITLLNGNNGSTVLSDSNWVTSEDTGFGHVNTAGTTRGTVKIIDADGNRVMAIEGRSEYQKNDAPVMQHEDISSLDPNKTYKLEFDMYLDTAAQAGGGIRFMVANKSNYYQLYWQGTNGYNDGTKRMSVWKSGPDGRLDTSAVSVNSGTYPAGGFPTGTWHHMTVVFANGEARWTAVNKETGEELTSFSGVFLQPAKITDNTDGTVIVNDNKIAAEGNVALKFFASGQNSQYTLFDNIVLNEYNVWTDGETEADNVLYYNASDIMRSNDGVYDLLNNTKIRRIVNDGASNFTMQVSEDGETYTDVEVAFTEGKWINTAMDAKVRYIKFADESVADNIDIYCEVEGGETLDLFVDSSLGFILREKGEDISHNIAYSDTYRLSNDDSSVTGVRDGVVDVQIYGSGVAKEVSINVIGEIGEAIINGTEEEYLAEKGPIVQAISDATDAQTIYDIIKSEGELKLSDIKDFDMGILPESDDEIMHVAQALIDYTFETETVDDVRDFVQTVLDEIYLLELLNLTDNTEIESVIEEYNDSFNLPLENRYYVEHKDDILTKFQNKDFENIMDLQKYFADTYVMTAFKAAVGYETIGVIVTECADEIGYNKSEFNALDNINGAKTDLFEQLKLKQSELNTVEAIKAYINAYEPEEEEEEEESSSDRYYGSSGGGTSITIPNVITTTNIPNADNTVVDKKQIYPDVSLDHWAYDGIRYLSAIDAVSGYEDCTFKPNNSITRAEFVKILMVAFEIEIPTIGEEDELAFTDITAADWYTPYFVAANNAGIVLGDGGNANPNVLISRQEMAVMIDRTVKMQDKVLPKINTLVRFDDESDIADWAYSAISKMQIADIINGYDTGNFMPKANATRAESAKMIYGSVLKAYVEPEPVEEAAQEETVNE